MIANKQTDTESTYIKMDYDLPTAEERIEKLNEIIASTPPEKLTSKYLERMADYLIDVTIDKSEKKKKRNVPKKDHF